MANLSDVYDISFETETPELAQALFAYIKKLEETPVEYNLTSEAELNGTTINGNWATGRWVYSSNLEGYFERPSEWCDDDGRAEYQKLVALLKKTGEVVEVNYSEDESGCQVFQDAYGSITWNEVSKGLSVNLEFTEHDRPCDIVPAEDEEGEENPEDKLYWCYAHEIFTNADDICEGAGVLTT